MAEANRSLSYPLVGSNTRCALGRQAREATGNEDRRATAASPRAKAAMHVTPDHFEMADEVLAKHRGELIAEAAEIVEQWRAEGFFGKRLMRCAPLTTSAHSAKA